MTPTLCLVDAVPPDLVKNITPALMARRESHKAAIAALGGQLIALEYRDAWQLPTLPSADAYKFDAPGQNEGLDHWLLQLGASAEFAHVRAREPGEVHARQRWFDGFSKALIDIQAKAPTKRWVNSADSILGMTDKWRCQQRLRDQGIDVPALLGRIVDFDNLRLNMVAAGCDRVFLKPRYGSSGSGVIALSRRGDQWTAVSSLVLRNGLPENSLRVRRHSCLNQIEAMVNAITAASPCYAERWIPKPRLPGNGRVCWDLRVVAWRGVARQHIARVSAHPICNLHLGNQRLRPDWLSPAQMDRVARSVGSIAEAFPDAQVFGADLIVGRDRVCVLEVNAFGDHLRDVRLHGSSSHDDQMRGLFAKRVQDWSA